MKFTYSHVFKLAGEATSWKSVKRTITTSSTMQAQFIAYYDSKFRQYGWKVFIHGLNIINSISKPFKNVCDNASVLLYFKNTRDWLVHNILILNILWSGIKLKNDKQLLTVSIQKGMIANLLTKSLASHLYNEVVICMSVLSFFDILE